MPEGTVPVMPQTFEEYKGGAGDVPKQSSQALVRAMRGNAGWLQDNSVGNSASGLPLEGKTAHEAAFVRNEGKLPPHRRTNSMLSIVDVDTHIR